MLESCDFKMEVFSRGLNNIELKNMVFVRFFFFFYEYLRRFFDYFGFLFIVNVIYY